MQGIVTSVRLTLEANVPNSLIKISLKLKFIYSLLPTLTQKLMKQWPLEQQCVTTRLIQDFMSFGAKL